MSIDKYEFGGDNIVGADPVSKIGVIPLYVMGNNHVTLTKADVIRLAIEFELTSHDIDCQEFKALQAYSDSADFEHFMEVEGILKTKIETDKNKH